MNPRQSRWAKYAMVTVATALAAFVLYLFSLGPAAWLVIHGVVPGPAFDAYASPVEAVTKRSDAAKQVWYWWLNLWTPRPPLPRRLADPYDYEITR